MHEYRGVESAALQLFFESAALYIAAKIRRGFEMPPPSRRVARRSVKVLTLPPPQASESWRPKEGKVFASASLERRQPGRRGLRTGGRGCRRVPCAGQAEASCVGYAAAACRHSGEESPGAAALPS